MVLRRFGTAAAFILTFGTLCGYSQSTPSISAVLPNAGTLGATAQPATIKGTNLTGATGVSFSGSGVTATIDTTQTATATLLPISITIAANAAPGLRTITVTTANGTSQPFGSFVVTSNPVPGINVVSKRITGNNLSGVIPDIAPFYGGPFPLTVNGRNFDAASRVMMNGTPLNTTVNSDSVLTAIVPTSMLPVAGAAEITVATTANISGSLHVDVVVDSDVAFRGYQVTLVYDTHVLAAYDKNATGGSVAGFTDKPTTVNTNIPGKVILNSFTTTTPISGTGLVIASFTFTPLTSGTTTVSLSTDEGDTYVTDYIGNYVPTAHIAVNPTSLTATPASFVSNSVSLKVAEHGDINLNRDVNIGDALVVALSVGLALNEPPLPASVGDINLNGAVNIGDALVLALYSGRVNPNLPAPQITGVTPSPVARGDTLTITGSGLGSRPEDVRVGFTTSGRMERVVPTLVSPTSVTVTVPNTAVSGPIQLFRSDAPMGSSQFPLTVSGTANGIMLSAVNPYFQVPAATSITLSGAGFDATAANNSVRFRAASGVVEGTVTAATATSLTVTVPSAALCGGVTVTAGGMTSNAKPIVIAATTCPVLITGLLGDPAPGQVVVLEGTGFNVLRPRDNVVSFGTASGSFSAPVLQSGATQLHLWIIGDNATDVSLTNSSGSTTLPLGPTGPLSVSITAPAGGASVRGTTTVAATASSTAVGVQFKLDGGNLGAEDTSAPFTAVFDTTLVGGGAHTLTAVARDAAGNTATATAVTVTVDNTTPTVSVTSPAGGTTITGTVSVNATAGDNIGVVGVQFQSDGVNIGAEDTSAPYSVSWDTRTTGSGSHNITAIARDAAGNTTTSAVISVTVDNVAPSVSITAPTGNSNISGTVTVTATATDNNSVAGIQFLLDGNNLGTEDTSAPYSVSWNTTTVTGGTHVLAAIARDAVGNTTRSADVTVTVDNVAPTVTMTAPAANATVSGSNVTVSAAASDDVGIAGVQFQLDGVNLLAEDTANPYSISWNTTTATDGTHTLRAVARDAAGNTTTSAGVTVTVSNSAANVSMTAPAANAKIRGTITVSANATSANGVAGVQFQVDGSNLGTEDTTAPYSVSWDTTTANGGTHTLKAIVRDTIGNTSFVTITVTVDNTAPSVSMTAPSANASVHGTTVTVSANATDETDVAGVQFQLDGSNLAAEVTTSPYSISWDTTSASNGTHLLRAVARDSAGNSTTSSTVSVTVDNSAPTVSITTPAANAVLRATVTVTAAASDNVAVAGIQFQLDGANLGIEATTPPSISWDTTTATNATHTLRAIARDAAGNTTTSASVSVVVDNAAPAVSLTAPAANAIVSGASVTVSASASDNNSVAGVQFQLDGVNLGAEDTTAPYSVTWDTTSSTSGAHILKAIARDAAGNTTTSAAISVTVDNAAPTVSISAPTNGSTVTGTVIVSANASDDVSVSGVQFKLDGNNLSSEDTTAPYSVSWNTTSATDGTHTLSAVARDAAGHTTTSASISVTVNNSPFSVVVTAPSANATVTGSVTVSATASGAAGVQFQLDGNNLGSERTSLPYSITWNTTSFADGTHTLRAIARDPMNQTTTSAGVTVIVDNTPPTVSISSPSASAVVSGSTVTVTANANDNIALAGVQFQLDGVNLGAEDTTAPYSVSWNTTSAMDGSHTLKAIARDGAGLTTSSLNVVVTVDNTAPTVSMTAPASNAVVTGTAVVVSATASDNSSIAGVQFQLDGVNLDMEDTIAPYSITWNTTTTTEGSHTLKAVARDAAGLTANSLSVVVTVDNTAPTVSMTAPAVNAVVSGTAVTLSANAADNVGIAGVQFVMDSTNIGAEDTTAPYSVTWNTTTFADGNHSVKAIARDLAGKTTTSAGIAVSIDNTAPTVSITFPAPSSTVTGTGVTVSANANDSVGIAGVQFQLDGVNLGTEDTSAPYSISWDTTTASAGTHMLGAIARDTAGNRTTVTIPVTVDNAAPTVSITSPLPNTSVGGTALVVSASASDASGVAGVQFQLDGVNLGAEDVTAPFSVVWDTTAAMAGAHTLRAIARDAVGNTATSASITVTVDNTAPTVSLTAPAPSAIVSGAAVTVSAGASDNIGIAGVQFQLDGASLGAEDTTAPYSVSWNSTTATCGNHTLAAVARDVSGNTAISATVSVTVDNCAPTVSFTLPAASAFLSGTVTVSATAADGVGVAGVQFELDGANLGAEDTTSPFSVTWNTTASTNGAHTLKATARDAVGNNASTTITVTVDNVAPSVSITAPASGSIVRGTVTVTSSASDNSGIAGVQFQLDGANLGSEVTALPYSISWNTTSAGTGSHMLSAIARDFAGNINSATIAVSVDNSAPTVSISSPAANALVAGTITVSATAGDNLGVSGVQFQLDGANLGSEDTSSPFSISWNTATASSGSHTLTAIARDAAGNSTTSNPIAVTVDNVAPTVSMTSPSANATVSGTAVIVSANASDNIGVLGVQFYLDGMPLGAEDTTAPYSTIWNTTTAARGTHTLTAVARDGVGFQTTSAAITVTVALIPTVSSISPNSATQGSVIQATITGTNFITGATTVAFNGTGVVVSSVNVASSTSLVATIQVSGASGGRTVSVTTADGTSGTVAFTINSNTVSQASALNVTTPYGVAGTTGSLDANGTSARFGQPYMLAGDATNLYLTEYTANTIRKITLATGDVSTLAGLSGSAGANVDGTGTAARFNSPRGVWSDGQSLYVADSFNYTIRKIVIATGAVTTIAGQAGTSGSTDATGTAATFNIPNGIWGDGVNLYISEGGGNRIRKLNLSTLAVTTVAGGTSGYVDATGTNARFAQPYGVWGDGTNLYIADNGNQKIRKMDLGTTVVTTVSATALPSPFGLWGDGLNLYIADSYTVDSLSIASNGISSVAGLSGSYGSSDGLGTQALFFGPTGVWGDGTSVYVTDQFNHTVRKLAVAPLPTVSSISPSSAEQSASIQVTVTGTNFYSGYTTVNISGSGVSSSNVNVTGSTSLTTTLTVLATAATGTRTVTITTPGGTSTTSVNFTVLSGTAPMVSITSPANNSYLAVTTVTLTATASDNVGVAGVQFRLNGVTDIGAEVTSSPYQVSWNTATVNQGTHSLTAIARDAAGHSTTSAAVTVTVDGTGPTVTVTAPTSATTVSGTSVTVSANASDSSGVAGVQFQLNGVNLGTEATSSPYSISWNTTTVVNGTYTLTAVARDTVGNTTTSTATTVTVENAPALQWVRQFGTNLEDDGTVSTIDSTGVYKAGRTVGTFSGQTSSNLDDGFIRKYDFNGNELWTRQFGSRDPNGYYAEDYVFGIASDSSNVYVAGRATTSDGSYVASYPFLRKYDSNGNLIWTREFWLNYGQYSFDPYDFYYDESANGVAVDSAGNVYLSGYFVNQSGSTGSYDGFIRKYDTYGNVSWTYTYGTLNSDFGDKIATNGTYVYASGITDGTFSGQTSSGYTDGFIIKLDVNGGYYWTRQFGSSLSDYFGPIAVTSDGGAVVAGKTYAAFSGQTFAGGADTIVLKYDASGNRVQAWTNQFGTSADDVPTGLATDSSGVYLSGFTSGTLSGQTSAGSTDAFLRKYDLNGNVLWTKQFGTSGSDVANSVSVNTTGTYVGGTTGGVFSGETALGGNDAFLARFGGTTSGTITTVAGTGADGTTGDGGSALNAPIGSATGIAVDSSGNIYIADYSNNKVRKVTPSGIISTVAGTGTQGYSGDGGAATSATLYHPHGLAVDTAGNLYIADSGNLVIRKVNTSGIISTVAGSHLSGNTGDGGAATSAKFLAPYTIAVDSSGNLFISDFNDNRIRKVNTSGIISAYAGSGTFGFSGDGGAATSAKIAEPLYIALDSSGNLYIADYYNNRIRKVTTAGVISTVAGNGNQGYNGDGIAATSASIWLPWSVRVDSSGNIYITDTYNNRIRKVSSSGIITTVVGTGTGSFSGDTGQAINATLSTPVDLAFDAAGNLYIDDNGNKRVRKVTLSISSSQ